MVKLFVQFRARVENYDRIVAMAMRENRIFQAIRLFIVDTRAPKRGNHYEERDLPRSERRVARFLEVSRATRRRKRPREEFLATPYQFSSMPIVMARRAVGCRDEVATAGQEGRLMYRRVSGELKPNPQEVWTRLGGANRSRLSDASIYTYIHDGGGNVTRTTRRRVGFPAREFITRLLGNT